MKLISVAAMSAAVVTGLAGAGVAYEIASGGDTPTASSVSDSSTAQAGQAGKAERPRFAPCRKPAVLEKGACVTDVVRIVALSSAGGSVGVAAARHSGDDGPLHDAFDDHGDHGPFHDAFDDHGGDDVDHSGHDFDDDDRDDFDDDDRDDHFDDDDRDDVDDDDHSGHGGDDSDDRDDD